MPSVTKATEASWQKDVKVKHKDNKRHEHDGCQGTFLHWLMQS